jgi:hypothetical protein
MLEAWLSGEPNMRRLCCFATAFGCLLYAAGARAEPGCCSAQSLSREAKRARTWRYAWTGVNAAVTAGSFALVPLARREDRPDWIVAGIGSGVTTVCTWLWPLRVETAEEELAALPAAERAQRLPGLLRESADDERARVTWPWHLANVALAGATGAVLAFGYHHYTSGAVTALTGTALGEVQLFTQPLGLARCDGVCLALPRIDWRPRAAEAPAAWTLSLSGSF